MRTVDRQVQTRRARPNRRRRAASISTSRIETRLWLLGRGTDRAEARMCAKFGRRDFRVYVNGGLLWSRNYTLDETQRFDSDAAARYEEFLALGWEAPGEATKGE